MSFNNISRVLIILASILIVIPSLFIPIVISNANIQSDELQNNFNLDISNSIFKWPIPGYTRISSYFGKRVSPTNGASSYHEGIDIPAPSGTALIAPYNSQVTFIGFNGSGGCTIILKCSNLEFIYHHVNPKYIVNVGDFVSTGQIIGQVGPKYVYGIKGNVYKDSNGKPTNGATTGPHLHFTIKKDGKAVNPLNYFS